MMVSPQNDHQNPKFPLMVRQDSLNNLNLNDNLHPKEVEEEEEAEEEEEEEEEEAEEEEGEEEEGEGEEALFIQNPSSSSSAPKVFGNIHLKELSCKTSIEHAWDKIFHVNATNSDMCFQEQFSLGETTSYEEQVLVSDGNVNDHHSMEISPQPLMSIDPMAMDDPPSFKVLPEIGNYLDDHQLLGFPALPLQVERKQVERKRRKSTNETMEKSVERRQRRMIKNRESAARSRARRQAHTTMLENQVSELRRRNNWLKKFKEAETVLNSDQQAAPRFQLRRTTSSTF